MVIRLFNRIERWASVSDDRATLVTILLCVAVAVLVLLAVGTTAWLYLRLGSPPPA